MLIHNDLQVGIDANLGIVGIIEAAYFPMMRASVPVSGARVEITSIAVKVTQHPQATMESEAHMMSGMYRMNHAMHNMPGMNTVPKVARSRGLNRMPGDYFAVIIFSAPGQWTLNTHSSINGQTLDANFPVNVVASHSASLAILAGFAGLNVLIIWVASVTKRRTVIAEPMQPTTGGL
jgi:hypothetical protein